MFHSFEQSVKYLIKSLSETSLCVLTAEYKEPDHDVKQGTLYFSFTLIYIYLADSMNEWLTISYFFERNIMCM